MAKGQKRSSREIRKPKQEKVAAKAEPTLGSQIKQATSGTSTLARKKS
ncbi:MULTISPECIES: hypothetical protein [Aquibium]|uniref:YuzL family protein n=1 Tax=Aquibium pacificus TaxID=3153579 RepID=A0ABV3SQ73_9HYPH|nr:hypothetical protein [Aquibium oceanicum]